MKAVLWANKTTKIFLRMEYSEIACSPRQCVSLERKVFLLGVERLYQETPTRAHVSFQGNYSAHSLPA
jgi:hypothetical protein